MATYTSTTSGLWSAGTTWVGGTKPPSAGGHKIVIAAAHVVTYDEADGEYGDDSAGGLTVNGTLYISRTVSTKLTAVGDIAIEAGGTFDCGTEGDPIPAAVTAEFVLNKSASMASVKWGLRCTFSAWAGFHICGAYKNGWAKVTTGALAADTVIAVDDTTGWIAGDQLIIEPTRGGTTHNSVVVYRKVASVTADTVTLTAAIGDDRPADTNIINVTRNVVFGSHTPATYLSYISIRVLNQAYADDIVSVANCEMRLLSAESSNLTKWGGFTMHLSTNTDQSNMVKYLKDFSVHHVLSANDTTLLTSLPYTFAGKLLANATRNNRATFDRVVMATLTSCSPMTTANASTVTMNDCVAIGRMLNVISTGYGMGSVDSLVSGGYYSANYVTASEGVSITFDSVYLHVGRILESMFVLGSLKFLSCTFLLQKTTDHLAVNVSANAVVDVENCLFPSSSPDLTSYTNLQHTTDANSLNLRNIGADTTQQALFTNGGLARRDNDTLRAGISVISLSPWFSGRPKTFTRKIGVGAGGAISIVGYMRHNAAYGVATLPTVTLSGMGASPVVATSTAAADTWQRFTLSITNPQSYPGEITLALSAQSTGGASAVAYFAGMPFLDYVGVVRHYGYEFDSDPFRTVDATITETTEATVAAYTQIDDLNQLYDRFKLWACDNPTEDELCSINNGELRVSDYNLTFDGTATDALDVTGEEITVKTATLAATSSLTSIAVVKTSGTITWVNGAVPGATLIYEDSTGRNVTITAPNLPDGTRVKIWDIAAASQLDNTIVTGGVGYIGRAFWTADKSLRMTATFCDGDTANTPISSTATLTALGAVFSDTFTEDPIYTLNGEDGSTVDEFVANYPGIKIDVDDADYVTTVKRLYAWFRFVETTYDGIANWVGGLVAEDTVNYRIVTSILDLTLNNTAAQPVRFIDGRLYRDNDTTVINATSGSIQMDPDKVYVRVVETDTSGLTAAESEKLFSLDTDVLATSIDALNDFDPTNDIVAHVELVDVTTTNTDMRGTDGANTVIPDNNSISAIKGVTDKFAFFGTDVKATLDGEEVTTNAASRLASQADVSALALEATVQEVSSKVDEQAVLTGLIPALL